jgi:hypothetical protein
MICAGMPRITGTAWLEIGLWRHTIKNRWFARTAVARKPAARNGVAFSTTSLQHSESFPTDVKTVTAAFSIGNLVLVVKCEKIERACCKRRRSVTGLGLRFL